MTTVEMERNRIQSLVSEYQRNGYTVKVRPTFKDLPAFLQHFKPDIVAFSERGNVVIEVKSAKDFDGDQIKQLAEIIDSQPSWKFEVVLVNPPFAPDVPSHEEIASDDQIKRFIKSAELLAGENQIDAAVLLAWAAVEAVLRRRARSVAPEVERESSARVLKHFYSLGWLDDEVHERLLRLLKVRNALSHGFRPNSSPPSFKDVLNDIRTLQSAA